MDNPEKNQKGNQEWTTQRRQKGQSRMDKPEKTKGAIKNGQPRENQRMLSGMVNTEENQRMLSGMDNPEKTKGCCQEWTIQRHIHYWEHGTERRQRRQKTNNTEN